MNIAIRRFQEKDATAVAAMIRRALFEKNIEDYPPDELEKIAQRYTAKNLKEIAQTKTLFVAEDREQIIGTATIAGDHITCVFVLPDYLRKGVGKQLMQIVEEDALARGVTKVRLESSLTAHAFYKRRGYENRDKKDVIDNSSTIHMFKILV